MIRISKTRRLITCLSLSVFPGWERGKIKTRKPSHLRTALSLTFLVVTACLFFHVPHAHASFNENMLIDAKGVGMANNVISDTSGIMSIYWNPGGLSLMGEGTYLTIGFSSGYMTIGGDFERDPNFEPYHDAQGNDRKDSVWGKTSETSTGQMYVPILDTTLPAMGGPVPFGISHRSPGSKWTFGYSIYMPFVGGWEFDDNDPAWYNNGSTVLSHLNYAAPAVSYRVNDKLSVGATFAAGQSVMILEMEPRSPNELTNITKTLGDATQGMANPIFDMTVPLPLFGGGFGPYDKIADFELNVRDDFSPSYTLGALYDPFDWITFGLTYHSPVKSKMTGDFSFKYSKDFQNMVAWCGSTATMQIVSMIFDLPYETTPEQKGSVSTELNYPQMVDFGITVKPLKRLALTGTLHWADWSSVSKNEIKFDQKIQLLQLAKYMGYTGGDHTLNVDRKFEDTLNWGVGGTFQALDWLQLRVGYEYRKSSAVQRYADLQLTLPTLYYVGTGLGIKGAGTGIKLLKDMDIDIGLGYMWSKKEKLPANYSENFNLEQLGVGFNKPYIGNSYEPKMTAILASLQATMPLEVITGLLSDGLDLLRPSKRHAQKDTKIVELKGPVDSSAGIINNMRYKNNYFFIEDSDFM
ncbi:MAG: outer membrane protein transport protein [Smithella sp.]